MYRSDQFKQVDEEIFTLRIPADRDFRILHLTDLHLGFGPLSKGTDGPAMDTVRTLIKRTEPHLIVLTGDSIFPFLTRSGTLNNRKQAQKLMDFLDGFAVPYTLVLGNHDCELLSACGKEELAGLYKQGRYCIFTEGRKGLTGVGNFLLELADESGKVLLPLVMLDSNMYGEGGWFFSGFDRIHDDQADWCMKRLDALKQEDQDIKGMAFFHMPLCEMKEAYEKMKLGDQSVVYRHGSIAEKGEYFGISRYKGTFFDRAVENGVIRRIVLWARPHEYTVSCIYGQYA